MKYQTFLFLLALVVCTFGIVQEESPKADRAGAETLPVKLSSQHLPNLVKVHPRVISGGLPEGDAAFQELVELGVKTIISVDGAKPDVDAAKRHGLRYVHLPHGYDGVPGSRVKELAKAVRDLEGPIYVHCHHGKHRSPAAASVACVAAGLIMPSNAVAILDIAGTSESYRGLYRSAREVKPISPAELDRLDIAFQEIVDVPPLAEAMVAIGHMHDHLKRIAEVDWRTPENHPDLEPAHETLLLREHFTELLRPPEVQAEPADFQRMLRESESAAQSIEEVLVQWKPSSADAPYPTALSKHAKRISDNCKACHEKYRDVPFGEK